jgi:hypothetical protein
MTVEQARQHLLNLMKKNRGYVDRATVEADSVADANRDVISAAAHQLASESGIIVDEESSDRPTWFPFGFMNRTE